MNNYIDINFISLASLTFFIILTLSWLVFMTLREGRKALKEVNRNLK